jgi:hypothetical protein
MSLASIVSNRYAVFLANRVGQSRFLICVSRLLTQILCLEMQSLSFKSGVDLLTELVCEVEQSFYE